MKHAGRSCWLIVLCAVLIVSGCSKNPEEKRADYLTSAQEYLQEDKLAEAAIQFQNALKIVPEDAATLTTLGEVQLKQKKVREAYSAFSRAIKADPGNIEAREYITSMLMLAREYDQAIEHARTILEQAPDNRKIQEVLAQALFLKGDKDEAVALMDELLADSQPAETTLINAVQMYLATGRTAAAQGLIERGTALYPQSSKLRFLASDYHAMQKDLAQATRWAREAYAVSGNDIVAGLALARFYAGHQLDEDFARLLLELKTAFPQDGRPLLLEAGVFQARGEVDLALQLVRKARELDDNTTSRHLESQLLLRKGLADEASQLLSEIIETDPEALASRLLLAEIHLSRNAGGEALALLDETLKTKGTRPDVAALAARAHLIEGDITKANNLVEAALQKNPANAQLHELKARIYFARKEYKKALAEVQGFKAPRSPELNYIGAIAALRAGRNDAAAGYVDNLKELGPQAWPTLHAEILLELARKNSKQAYQLVLKALELNPANQDALRIYAGLAPQAIGRDKAIAAMEARCRANTNPTCEMLTAGLLEKAGRTDKALGHIKAAIDLEPDNTNLFHSLAAFYTRNDMTARALKEYERLLNEQPDDLRAGIMLALLYQGQDKTDEAARVYEYILKKEPAHALASNNLAWILAQGDKADDLNRALQLAQKAKDAYPEDPRIADTLGYVYLKKGLAANAEAQFAQAMEKLPDEAEIQYHMALALIEQERHSQARPYLEKAAAREFAHQTAARKLLAELPQ